MKKVPYIINDSSVHIIFAARRQISTAESWECNDSVAFRISILASSFFISRRPSVTCPWTVRAVTDIPWDVEKGKVLVSQPGMGLVCTRAICRTAASVLVKSAGFGKDDITCIHIGRNMICKSKNPDLGILPGKWSEGSAVTVGYFRRLRLHIHLLQAYGSVQRQEG